MRHVTAQGVNGGTSTTSYGARILNTLFDPVGIVQNASAFTGTGGSNTQFTLLPGTYRFNGNAATIGGAIGGNTNIQKLRLYNVTAASVVNTGNPMFSTNSSSGSTRQIYIEIDGGFTITQTSTFELQQISSTAIADGRGYRSNIGGEEVYVSLTVTKVF